MDLEEIMSRGIKRSPKDRPCDSTYTRDLSTAGLREADPSVEDARAGEGTGRGHSRVQSSVPRGVALRGGPHRAPLVKNGAGLFSIC